MSQDNITFGVIVFLLILVLVFRVYTKDKGNHKDSDNNDNNDNSQVTPSQSIATPSGATSYMLTDGDGNMYTMPTTNVSTAVANNATNHTNLKDRFDHLQGDYNTTKITYDTRIYSLETPFFFWRRKHFFDNNALDIVSGTIYGYGNGKTLGDMYGAGRGMDLNSSNRLIIPKSGFYKFTITLNMYGDNVDMDYIFRRNMLSTGQGLYDVDKVRVSLDDNFAKMIILQGYETFNENDEIYLEFYHSTGSEIVHLLGINFMIGLASL